MRIIAQDREVTMGIDVAAKSLDVTVIEGKAVLKHAQLVHRRSAIESFLARLPGCRIHAVYEAGCFGYWLWDTLRELGVDVMVTAPSKVPRRPGEKVKTDRRDSMTLAVQLQAGALKKVAVPTKERRGERQLVRTRVQMVRARVRVMCQIRSLLLFHHIEVPEEAGKRWSETFVKWLESVPLAGVPGGEYIRQSLDSLVVLYRHLTLEVGELTKEFRPVCKEKEYAAMGAVLRSHPGIGVIGEATLLTELGPCGVEAFARSEEFVSFLGLVPSEHSTGETRHRGRITKAGNRQLRRVLIECAWSWVRQDPAVKARYEELKRRRGSGRAIVAIARRLAVQLYWQLRHLARSQRAESA